MIWSKNETLSREEIEKIQLERLQETVFRVYEKVEPYRKKMIDAGVKPEDIEITSNTEDKIFIENLQTLVRTIYESCDL